eukprot:gene8637-34084_t
MNLAFRSSRISGFRPRSTAAATPKPLHVNSRRGVTPPASATPFSGMFNARDSVIASAGADYSSIAAGSPMPDNYDKDLPDTAGKRRSGVIVHPSSLPGPYGIGEIGPESKNLLDWMTNAGLTIWQILPMVPPDPMFYSPYSGTDANCGNPLLISIDELMRDGLLEANEHPARVPVGDVDFAAVAAEKMPKLQCAAGRLLVDPKFAELKKEMTAWREAHAWVEDSAMFEVARNLDGLNTMAWWDWPEDLRFRKPEALLAFAEEHKEKIDEWIALQFLFDRQWLALRIVGDMPIYVGGHSSDVWANQALFELDPETCAPSLVSGVPPDAFSETGQLWGSPLYRWDAHKAEGYAWWISRLGRAMELFDEYRIDHFRGFAGYWAVEATAETAMGGKWMKGPGVELFDAMKEKTGAVPILAEDLGVITTDVVELREAIGAPGMVVLQFAWGGGPGNVHLPHNHYENCFVYPGTHDNETAVGWFKDSATDSDKESIVKYLKTDGRDIAWDFINSCMLSSAGTCVILMQDVMRLDNSARINTPGKAEGNWAWRMGDSGVWHQLSKEANDLQMLAEKSYRLPKISTLGGLNQPRCLVTRKDRGRQTLIGAEGLEWWLVVWQMAPKEEFKPKSSSKQVLNAPKGGKAKDAKRAEAKAKKADKAGGGGLTTKK